MHGVVAHIESGVRTLNQMQLRELVRMLGALALEITNLKITAEALLEEEESDQSQRTQPSAETDEATTETDEATTETDEATTETIAPVA